MMLRVLFLCFAIALPAVAAPLSIPDQGPALRIQGSNTIGAALGPALVKGLMEYQGLQDVRAEPGAGVNEQRVVGKTRQGQTVTIEVAAHGSSTGFAALKNNRADLAAASRPINDSELVDLDPLGDLKTPGAEHVIAIDGLAIIVNPRNPLNSLNTEQLAQIFNGEVSTWEALGGTGGTIHLYARDDQSGTFDTFRTYFAPANLMEAVGTYGQELYAHQLARPNGTGIDIYTQSNPLPIVKRPALTVRLHSSNGW